jgi:hypothetical protein
VPRAPSRGGTAHRTLFLIFALLGFGTGSVLTMVDNAKDASHVLFAVATVPLLIWIIAVGVEIGFRDYNEGSVSSSSIPGTPAPPR